MSQTEFLAIWGALTGTLGSIAGFLGLWLRFKQHKLDQVKLLCSTSFGFQSPNNHDHKIIIRSVGRRATTIDHIRFYVLPDNWKLRLLKKYEYSKGRWIWDQKIKDIIRLEEAEKYDLKIKLPVGLKVSSIYQAKVFDQAGNSWVIKWPRINEVIKLTTEVELMSLTQELDNRFVEITGHRLGNKYLISTYFNTKPQRTGVVSGCDIWFFDENSYNNKIKYIKDVQVNKFLNGEIEEIR
jgi:hypothetical protein